MNLNKNYKYTRRCDICEDTYGTDYYYGSKCSDCQKKRSEVTARPHKQDSEQFEKIKKFDYNYYFNIHSKRKKNESKLSELQNLSGIQGK